MSERDGGPAFRATSWLARRILRLGLRGPDREFLIGDLEEAVAARRREGDGRAGRWFLWQALRSVARRRLPGGSGVLAGRADKGDGLAAELVRDLSFAGRQLRAERGFALAVILMLSLGVGGTTAIFTFVNGLLLKPLPYAEGHRVVEIQEVLRSGNTNRVDWFNFRDWRQRAESFESMEAFYATSFNAFDGDEPVRISGLRVGARLFEVLRARPALGRTFSPGEDEPGGEPVVVIADSLWRRLFGGDPEILGRSLRLQGVPHTIVGVMPPGFHFREYAELWVPHGLDPSTASRGSNYWRVVARLAPGVELEAARSEMDRIGRRLAQEHPVLNEGRSATAIPLREAIVGESGLHAMIFLISVVLVQLIATVNVGNLLLARSLTRRREMAIRSAIGAGRGRLVRQLLTESLLLAALGGVGGLILGLRGRTWILDSVPIEIPRWFDFSFDLRVAAFCLVASGLAGIVFGLVPALYASRDMNSALRDGDRGVAAVPRLRRGLVVAEVALTLVLLVGAGLMLKAAERTRRVDPGVDPTGVLTFRISLPTPEYEEAEAHEWYVELRERLATLPRVENAAAISRLPLSNSSASDTVWAEGMDLPPGGRAPAVNFSVVSGDYFGAMRVPIREGGDLSRLADDRFEVVVSEELAERLWPDASPVGRRIKLGNADSDQPWMTVVGVAAGVRHYSLRDERTTDTIYVPLAHSPQRSMTLVVRTAARPLELVDAVRATVSDLDPDIPVYDLRTMERVVSDSMWQSRLYSWMFGVFAALALALAFVGLYGLVAFGVRRQRREIGVRLALGAVRTEVVRLIVLRALGQVALGVGFGLLAAAAFSRLMSSLVFGVSVLDPMIYGGVTIALLAVGSLAALTPALRAARVDPLIALRTD